MTELAQLTSSFERYPIIVQSISEGTGYAAELRHSVLTEYHCYHAVLRRVPAISISDGSSRVELGAEPFDKLIRESVAQNPHFTSVTMVAPTLCQALHAVITDAAHRRRIQVGLSDLILSPLARPLSSVYQTLSDFGMPPQRFIAPALATFGEDDEKAAVKYYTGLHDLLNSTYPYPIRRIRHPEHKQQLEPSDVDCIPGYRSYRDKNGNIRVVPTDWPDQ